MKRTLLKIAVLSMIFLPWAASATVITSAPCTVGSGNCATGIHGLDVGGTLYDLSFVVDGSYSDTYASTAPTFMGDGGGARVAAQSILDLLSPSGLSGVVSHSPQHDHFLVPYYLIRPGPYMNSGMVSAMVGGFDSPTVAWFGVDDCSDCLNKDENPNTTFPDDSYAWAVFSPAAGVPEPSSLALISLGLVGFGFSRLKGKTKHRT